MCLNLPTAYQTTGRLGRKRQGFRGWRQGLSSSPRSGEHKFRSATFKNGNLHMEIDREYAGTAVTLVYGGKLSGKRLSGKVVLKGYEDQLSGTWEAKLE